MLRSPSPNKQQARNPVGRVLGGRGRGGLENFGPDRHQLGRAGRVAGSAAALGEGKSPVRRRGGRGFAPLPSFQALSAAARGLVGPMASDGAVRAQQDQRLRGAGRLMAGLATGRALEQLPADRGAPGAAAEGGVSPLSRRAPAPHAPAAGAARDLENRRPSRPFADDRVSQGQVGVAKIPLWIMGSGVLPRRDPAGSGRANGPGGDRSGAALLRSGESGSGRQDRLLGEGKAATLGAALG